MNVRSIMAQVNPLLRLELKRRSFRPARRLLFMVILPLMNLFFCAYCERMFEAERDLPALQLFLFIESSALAFLAVVHFISMLREVLKKTLLLPVGPLPVALFIVLSLFREPLSLGMLITGAFGLTIMLHPPGTAVPFIPLFMVLLATGVQTLVGGALLVATTRSDQTAGLVLLVILSMLGGLLWSLLFRSHTLPGTIPPVLWSSVGILSAIGKDWGGAFMRLLLLAVVPPAALALSSWWMKRR